MNNIDTRMPNVEGNTALKLLQHCIDSATLENSRGRRLSHEDVVALGEILQVFRYRSIKAECAIIKGKVSPAQTSEIPRARKMLHERAEAMSKARIC